MNFTGTPKWLTAPAGAGGTHTASVVLQEDSSAYTIRVNPEQGPPPPKPRADFDFTNSGTATDGSWQVFRFDVAAGEQVDARVIRDNPDAAVKVFPQDETRNSIDSVTDGSGSPATMSAVAASAGRWSVAVKINSGKIDYDVLVDTTSPNP